MVDHTHFKQKGIEKKTFQAISKALSQGILSVDQIAEMMEVSTETVLNVQQSLDD